MNFKDPILSDDFSPRPMSLAGDFRLYSRFFTGLRSFLAEQWSVDSARAEVEGALARREERFLRLAERAVFGVPESPYFRLMAHAGCTLGDLRAEVATRGLEGALLALRAAGVYVRFEEFKGYEPIVRGALELPVRASDFDNPFLSSAFAAASGGSTGAGTRVWLDLDHLAAASARMLLGLEAHGLARAPHALWRGPLPSAAGINSALRLARLGNPPERWFSHVRAAELGGFFHRSATPAILAASRLCGGRLPSPEYVPLDRAEPIARWARSAADRAGRSVIGTTISQAARIAAAAVDAGIGLEQVTFLVGGEPVTAGKIAALERSGARHVPAYHFVETGLVAFGCARPVDGNDLHLNSDQLALVQFPREVAGAPEPVPAFHFTTLAPTAPKILLNVESDDYGLVETRVCGCPLGELGYSTHVREIASFRKLTGAGVTLVGSEMERILEQVLPARFGGTPLDWQLLEEEDPVTAATRVFVVADPKLGPLDEGEVVECVLRALEGRGGGAAVTRTVWRAGHTLGLRREAPQWTSRGKLLPLRHRRAAR